jgi:hypothetical protein
LDTTIDPKALLAVNESMRSAVQGYAEIVRQLAGDNLAGLTVFGGVLDADFEPSRMPVTSVMVLERIDLNVLRRLAEHGPKLGSRHITAPLVMTPEYVAGSLDTFPLELLEIHQRHATLCGRDYFASLDFAPQHLRLQCERELKRILIRMRQGLLTAAGREVVLVDLKWDLGQHLLRTLRGLLWLKGTSQHLPREQVLSQTEKLLDKALPAMRDGLLLHGGHDWKQFVGLYQDIEFLAGAVDAL